MHLSIIYRPVILLISLMLCIGCTDNTAEEKTSVVPEVNLGQRNQPRVGLVDMQRLSDSLGISKQLDQKRKKLQQDWNRVDSETRQSLTSALDGFGGDMEKLSEAQRAELQKLQLDRRRRLTKVEQENTAAIQETSRWLRRVLAEKTKSLIDAVGNDFGFDLILIRTPGEVAFARKGVDITERILQRAGVTSEVENTEGQVTGGDDTGEPTETPN